MHGAAGSCKATAWNMAVLVMWRRICGVTDVCCNPHVLQTSALGPRLTGPEAALSVSLIKQQLCDLEAERMMVIKHTNTAVGNRLSAQKLMKDLLLFGIRNLLMCLNAQWVRCWVGLNFCLHSSTHTSEKQRKHVWFISSLLLHSMFKTDSFSVLSSDWPIQWSNGDLVYITAQLPQRDY